MPHAACVPQLFLLIAGARTSESDELVRLAEELAPGRVKILLDLDREEMPLLYRCMDVFAHASLFEMMHIAILEAMATGLPCVVNKHPNLEWMIGDGGVSIDMSAQGALANTLGEFTTEGSEAQRRALEERARKRAETAFSEEAVIPQILEMYEEVMQA